MAFVRLIVNRAREGRNTVESEWELPRRTQFEAPGPVMGGMRWNGGRPRLVDFCQRTGVVYPKYDKETSMPAPLVHAGPHIVTAAPGTARAGEEYVYQPAARDASVNGFTWSFVKPPPPGMEIDRYGGKITWPPVESCRVEVEIRAYTHHGRQARQAWTIAVGKAAPVRVFTPHPRFVEALRRKALRLAGRVRPAAARGGLPSTEAICRKNAAKNTAPTPARDRATGGGPHIHTDATAPPLRRLWGVARRTLVVACRAAAPPSRPHGVAALPLRL